MSSQWTSPCKRSRNAITSTKSNIYRFLKNLITARKQSLRRLCFYRCLSVHRGVCMAGGVCGRRGHAWWKGVCMGVWAYMAGRHAWWGCAWQWRMCGRGHAWQGACVMGCMCGKGAYMAGGHTWQGGIHGRGHAWQIPWDTVNEQVVCFLLEWILV